MDCAKYKDWLSAATLDALDAGQRAEWQAHLESCGDCRAELDRSRQFLAAMDQAVARTTEGEPSPAFAARVRQRIEEQAPAANWFAGWLPATAGALAVLALVVWMWNRQPAQPVPDARPPVVAEKPPVQVPPAQEAAAEIVPQPVKIHTVRAQPALVIAAPRAPEVLIPVEHRAAVDMLYRSLRRDRARATAVLEGVLLARAETQQALQVPELEAIPRLEIVPLVNKEPSRTPQE